MIAIGLGDFLEVMGRHGGTWGALTSELIWVMTNFGPKQQILDTWHATLARSRWPDDFETNPAGFASDRGAYRCIRKETGWLCIGFCVIKHQNPPEGGPGTGTRWFF